MRCPVSGEELVIVEIDGIELDVSIDGHGIWFDAQELQTLFEKSGAPEALHELEARLKRLPHPRGPKRQCPRCDRKMWHVALTDDEDAVVLDACPDNHGLWFDKGELEQVLELELSGDDDALARVRQHLGAFLRSSPD